MEIELRKAVADDEGWLFELHEAAHRELVEAAYGPWVVEQQEEFFRPLVDDHEVFVVVAEGHDVGAVYLGERDGDTWLELIEVEPAHQGEGIGAAALRWVVSGSADRGRGTLLQVHRINDGAKQLYEREGFASVGETPTHHLLRRP
ncbi:GNAT family N-acetyltransferase [Planctomonas sp. JC2975]|uniref:GNAT family N-acetyltransferase n=1 Tax=Planctomonas sp. JC2975 TaxID=2729626 RepID=UPI001474652A|nr:GNAT family N-acetyltransferase [Planctomonas sp. JC2975]NNC13262.1 GNAT family N-acetyltransferase [Planctomonas sp. JC2975]